VLLHHGLTDSRQADGSRSCPRNYVLAPQAEGSPGRRAASIKDTRAVEKGTHRVGFEESRATPCHWSAAGLSVTIRTAYEGDERIPNSFRLRGNSLLGVVGAVNCCRARPGPAYCTSRGQAEAQESTSAAHRSYEVLPLELAVWTSTVRCHSELSLPFCTAGVAGPASPIRSRPAAEDQGGLGEVGERDAVHALFPLYSLHPAIFSPSDVLLRTRPRSPSDRSSHIACRRP
jgi:hypothetical protein